MTTRWLRDRRRAVALAVVVLIVAGGVAVAWDRDGSDATRTTDRRRSDEAIGPRDRARSEPDGSTTTTDPKVRAEAAGEAVLLRFTDCASVLDHARAQAIEHVTAYGLAWQGRDGVAVATDSAAGSGASRSAAPSASGGPAPQAAESPAFSTTNVQEAGVDEPDIVKNNGERAFTIVAGRLRAVFFDEDGLQAGDAVDLDVPDDAELLEVGDDLVVLSSGDGVSTRVVVINARDPRDLQIIRQIDVEGAYLSARRIGDTVRLVVTQNGPAFEFTYPQSNDEAEVARALAHNRAAVRRARLAEWLPDVTFDGTRRLIPAPACGDVYLTPTFAGPGSTTVVTLSPADGKVLDATAVLATASEVYATTDHLYVATSAWGETTDLTTEIHRFDVSEPTRSVYEATGSVPGHLLRPPWFVGASNLGQWALSEHDGHLRVATTTVTENVVTVLRRTGEAMLPVGVLNGLGRGEQLYAVRFMGNRGYVVTYRKVDPLFVLDLADPTAPRVVGELKVPGYSAYLHPIGDGLLLGIGQDDPDEDGLADGTQVSVFDVSDPARPERLAQLKLGERGTLSGVEGDHRTFTWWPDPARAVLTLTNWEDPSRFHGAVALDVKRGGIREVGRVEHRPGDDRCPVPVTRSRVIGDALVTFSSVGVRSHALDDLAPRSSLRYEGAPDPGPCSRPPSTSPTSTSTTTTALPLPTGRD